MAEVTRFQNEQKTGILKMSVENGSVVYVADIMAIVGKKAAELDLAEVTDDLTFGSLELSFFDGSLVDYRIAKTYTGAHLRNKLREDRCKFVKNVEEKSDTFL